MRAFFFSDLYVHPARDEVSKLMHPMNSIKYLMEFAERTFWDIKVVHMIGRQR